MRVRAKCLQKFLWKLCIGFGLSVASTPSYSSQNAVVVTDGAIVYKKADFDSPIIGYFRAGQKVKISDKTFGPFFRVRFKQGLVGYVADIDVNPQGGKNAKSGDGESGDGDSKQSAQKKHGKSKHTVNQPNAPKSLLTRNYLGFAAGMVNWAELFTSTDPSAGQISKEYSDSLIFYGLKWTLPFGSVLGGPFLFDITSVFSLAAPDYLKSASTIEPSGLIAIVNFDVLYVFSEIMNRQMAFYFGGGPAVTYNSFLVEISGSKKDLLEVQIGGAGTLGAVYRFGNTALKLEGKYYFTKSTYFGVLGTIQVDI